MATVPRFQRQLEGNTPYSNFRWFEKLGYEAALDSYNYDNSIPLHSSDIVLSSSVQKVLKFYRSSPNLRGNVTTDQGTMRYVSDLSFDSLAVYVGNLSTSDEEGLTNTENVLILGFRGTDNVDPIRFMNWFPDDYNETLANVIRSKKFSKSLEKDLINEIGTSGFDDVLIDAGYKLIGSEKCGAYCDRTCDPGITKESLLSKATNSYCSFTTSVSTVTKPGLWNIYQYDITSEALAAYATNPISGGSGTAEINSDCKADRTITVGTTSREKVSINDIRRDEKHKITAVAALDYINKLEEYNKVIFAGHSLGGSLAFNAYSLALEKFGNTDKQFYYAGFNAATLGNYNDVARRLKSYDSEWKYKASAHRNSYDIVSQFSGKEIPTIQWQGSQYPIDFQSSNTHGLLTFKFCSENLVKKDYAPSRKASFKKFSPAKSPRRSMSKKRSMSTKRSRTPDYYDYV